MRCLARPAWCFILLFSAAGCTTIDGLAVTIGSRDDNKDSGSTPADASVDSDDHASTEEPEETDTHSEGTDSSTETDTPGETDPPEETDPEETDTPEETDPEETDSREKTDASDASSPEDTETTAPKLTEVELPIDYSGDLPFIPAEENDLMLQGWWHAYDDPNEANTYISLVPSPPDAICVEGKVSDAPGGDYATYFGAKAGFEVCAKDPPTLGYTRVTPQPLESCYWTSGLEDKMVGIKFNLTGTVPKHELRIQFAEQHDRSDGPYVIAKEEADDYEVLFENATVAYDPSQPPCNIPRITGIFFYIPSFGGPSEFNFCIENLRVLAYLP